MRPLELTLDSFRSHRKRVTFDWRDRHLVGIVGPIGSGKSSILDAIAFALYGKTPTFERDTRSLIHQLCDGCQVALRFQVEGQTWKVVRALKRRGQSGHKLEHLSGDEPDAESLEIITGEAATRGRIEQLLGLDFDAFCRSILLAQNQFAQFLEASPGERNRVLKGVFGLERLDAARTAAKSRLERARGELDTLADQRRAIEEAKSQIPTAAEQETEAAIRLEQFKKAESDVETCVREQKDAELKEAQASDRLKALDRIHKDLPSGSVLEATLSQAEGIRTQLDTAEAHANKTGAIRSDAEKDFEETEKRIGDRKSLTRLREDVAKLERWIEALERERGHLAEAEANLEEARSRIEQRTAEAESAEQASQGTRTALVRASEAADRLESKLASVRHAQYAAELRNGISAGERCPVCQQEVHELPKASKRPADLEAAELAYNKARTVVATRREENELAGQRVATCSEALRSAKTAMADAAKLHKRARGDVQKAEEGRAASDKELRKILGRGDPRLVLDRREQQLDAAEHALEEAGQQERQARDALDGLTQAAAQVQEKLVSLANALASAWGRLNITREVAATPDALRATVDELLAELTNQRDDSKLARDEAATQARDVRSRLAAILGALGLPTDADFQKEKTEAAVLHGRAEQRQKELKSQVREGRKLDKKIEEAEARRDLADRLTKDMSPFLAYLLEGQRAELAELGSEHLERLTAGDYRFTEGDRFDVVDLNAAGTERTATSLSGGETFLASLALALGLAEMVARGGGRLDAFFLDEGFGSLDPEHLDLAMDGIGKLISTSENRLVVLVSHVPEMKEAIEDLIVLDKDEQTGDTRVISGAIKDS